MNTEKKYYSKLMIAGEYGVLAGSEALTMPLKNFYARIVQKKDSSDSTTIIKSVSSLRKLFNYIHTLPKNSFYAQSLDNEMESMLNDGYYIESTIPHAYGIGSSGAVSAIIYDQFFRNNEKLDMQKQRKDLATIESFYHGKSSGVDAMTCFKASPLHFFPDGKIIPVDLDPHKLPGGNRFFLLDSGTTLSTEPMVNSFIRKMEKESFRRQVLDDYIPLIKKFIASLYGSLEVDPALLFRAISDFQWTYFREMIPEIMEEPWIHGQVSNNYYLKINGSGGGFLLGIAPEESMEALNELMEGYKLIWL